MQQFSLSIAGVAVMAIAWLLNRFGIVPADSEIAQVVSSAAIVGGWVMAYIGRIRKGDLTWWGTRK